jgi:hypothetical protein
MEQRQLLVQKILMPSGISWKEPSPMKPVQFDGHSYVEICDNELRSYANGCRNIASVIDVEQPDTVIVSLRGAYPVSRCVDHFAQSRIPKVHAKTSYFLNQLSRKVDKALYSCERKGRLNKVLMIDTSVTGRKLSWFLPQMLGSLSERVAHPLEFVTAVLWNDKEGWKENTEKQYGSIRNVNYNFGVKNLICEDNPTLLGVKYVDSKDRCHAAAYSEVNAYAEPVAAHIHVKTDVGTKVHKLERNGRIGCTADLFVDLVRKYA